MLGIRTLRRLVGSLRRRGRERDPDDELGFHLAMRIERNTREGMTPDAAVHNAHTRFGDIEEVKTAMRKANRPTLTQLLWSPTAIGAIATLLVTVGAGMWFMGGPPGTGGDHAAARRTAEALLHPGSAGGQVQGAVIMTCVVQLDGACTDIDVVESLDTRYGLDNQAAEALAKWRFEPGARHDEPVPVWVTVEIIFTLR